MGLVALIVAAGRGLAAPTPGEGKTVEWIRPEEVPIRADALRLRLDATQPTSVAQASVENIERRLPQVGGDLDGILGRATNALTEAAPPSDLEDIRGELADAAKPLAVWKDQLQVEAKRVAETLGLIARDERVWSETRGRPETTAAGELVVRRVESSLAALTDAATKLGPWRARVLAASDRVIGRTITVDITLDRLRAASEAERASLLVPDRRLLWAGGFGAQVRSELPRVPQAIFAYAESTATYVRRDLRPLVVQALLAALVMLLLRRYSAQALERLAEEEAAPRAARLLERPYAIGLLLALVASPLVHPLAPRRFMQLVALVALVPAARIVTRVAEHVSLPAFGGLFVVLLLERARSALQPLPAIQRVTFLLTLAFGLGLAGWFARRVGRGGDAAWLRRAAHLAMLGLAVAFLAEVGGWTYLAALLGRGILAGALAAVYVYAAAIALAALVACALTSRTVRRSRVLGNNTAVLLRRTERALPWFAVGLWLYFMATALGLRGAAAGALATLFNAGFSVGALSLSIGGVLAFGLTLLAAMLLARVATAILEEDVYPRARLPRGVPYALSTIVRYGVYSLGFLFALAAAGVQVGQVAIMLGGFGVGVGLGLQDLVRNFAAGLTLLFERRVHVGDTLEMPSQGIFGRVLSIGMRASVVRSWNGTEVVVPNADLVSSAVTNWTLSDRLCRIEVPVGVAYGTDPERVVVLLLDAVRSNDQLLREPAPQAFFKGFGESSLDFVVRAWIDRGYEGVLPLTSELALGVHRALCDAGVAIPFPQRDLHLASVSPAARAALAAAGPKDRPGQD